MQPKVNYITKKDFLREINNSKKSFCSFIDNAYQDFHAIVVDKAQITPELIDEIVAAKLKPKGKAVPVLLKPEEVVIRVMTHEHIPLDPDRKRKARNTDQSYARTNFPPFKHFILKDGEVKEVGRSHWVDGLENGHFSVEHGRINNRLATMFMLLVDRISLRGNWRGYSYVDEMRGHALAQLSQVGLMFDESKSDNPFAFYTTAVNHSFTRVLNLERKSQSIRDDMLIMSGNAPSITRQVDNELSYRFPKTEGEKKTPTKKRVTKAAPITIKED